MMWISTLLSNIGLYNGIMKTTPPGKPFPYVAFMIVKILTGSFFILVTASISMLITVMLCRRQLNLHSNKNPAFINNMSFTKPNYLFFVIHLVTYVVCLIVTTFFYSGEAFVVIVLLPMSIIANSILYIYMKRYLVSEGVSGACLNKIVGVFTIMSTLCMGIEFWYLFVDSLFPFA